MPKKRRAETGIKLRKPQRVDHKGKNAWLADGQVQEIHLMEGHSIKSAFNVTIKISEIKKGSWLFTLLSERLHGWESIKILIMEGD